MKTSNDLYSSSEGEIFSEFETDDFKDIDIIESNNKGPMALENQDVYGNDHCSESDVQTISDFLQEIDKVGHKETFIKFFSMVKNKQFPLNNIAFNLFTDVITWFSKADTRGMRYSQPALKFFWLGKKLFGGRFVCFMSGLKNETDLLT